MNFFILHIETSTEACSVALSKGEVLLSYVQAELSMDHAAKITLLIGDCLSKAGCSAKDLHALSVSAGPGSYTALRIGASVAKGMCYALDIPLIAVDTLTCLAQTAALAFTMPDTIFVPMIDARRMEVYTAFFDQDINVVESLHSLIVETNTFDRFLQHGKKVVLTGNAVEKCKDLLPNSPNLIYYPLTCSARWMIAQASQSYISRDFSNITSFTPEYGKQPNITTAKKIF